MKIIFFLISAILGMMWLVGVLMIINSIVEWACLSWFNFFLVLMILVAIACVMVLKEICKC